MAHHNELFAVSVDESNKSTPELIRDQQIN